MNTKSNSSWNKVINTIIAIITIVNISATARAAEPKMHNPYTILGHQLRAHLIEQTPEGKWVATEPTVFQEIVPCRLVSTLPADKYPSPWGGAEFQPSESRQYYPKGILVNGEWTNPCSELIPMEAVAVSLRLMSYEPEGDGTIWLAPASTNAFGNPALHFVAETDTLKEANVMLRGGAFRLMVADEATHLTVDIIGYFLPDPYGRGLQGEKGERGEQGSQGERGLQGERGEKGERGEAGTQGERGLQGERGEKGERGEAGAQGLKGDKGERGEAGAQGLKGDKGDAGAQGTQGDRGPMGPQGPQGPRGTPGILASSGGPYVFPPGGTLVITDGTVNVNSFVIPVYEEVSNGNAIAIESVSNGRFVASGSPNKPFRYIVINIQ